MSIAASAQTPSPPSFTLAILSAVTSSYLTVSVNPPGNTYAYPVSNSYPLGTTVSVQANDYTDPTGGILAFTSWQGDYTSYSNPITITMDGPKTITASYVSGDPPSVTLISLTPSSGFVGTIVTIQSNGKFELTGNTIDFASSTEGLEYHKKVTASSPDKYTIQFAVPAYLSPYCLESSPPCGSPDIQTPDAYYNVSVLPPSASWGSNSLMFTVISGMTAVPTTAPTAAPTGLLADVNSSNTIDIVDALMVAQYYVGLSPSHFIAANADATKNGTVDIVDTLRIAQYYVGLISGF